MGSPDPITTGLTVAAMLSAAKQVENFIAAVAGHPGESISTILGNMAHRRLKNAESVAEKAHFILLDIGAKPKEVPLDVLQPLLESASLQEDEYLQDAWAKLLANAATGGVPPSYVAILREFGRREVVFLQTLWNGAQVNNPTLVFKPNTVRNYYSLDRLQENFRQAGLSREPEKDTIRVNQSATNQQDDVSPDGRVLQEIVDLLRRAGTIAQITAGSPPDSYFVTALGWGFLSACQSPKSKADN